MISITPQLSKIAIKKRASHPPSFREHNTTFRKIVDKIKQAEITKKLKQKRFKTTILN